MQSPVLPPRATTTAAPEPPAAWGAVLAVSLGAFALVASEFMPVSLLTPIAHDLHVSEGQAGHAISISGAFGLLTSLFVSALVGRLDRKVLLLALTGLMIAAGSVAAFAPGWGTFLIGRALIGVAIGGFWSMSAAVVMRLVPPDRVPKALALVNGGNALATVIAPPLGSFLGAVVGWRWAFFCVVPVAALALVWKWLALPAMTVEAVARPTHPFAVFALLKQPVVARGMLAVSLFFMGQFALFTYLRPFLESVTHVGPRALTFLLLLVGVSGVVGTTLIGRVTAGNLYRTLVVMPFLLALTGAGLLGFGSAPVATALLLCSWGFLGTSAPVAWWTWVARTLPRDAEAGGGLMVAVVQLAIGLGATLGGVAFDASGYRASFATSIGLLVVSGFVAASTARAERAHFAKGIGGQVPPAASASRQLACHERFASAPSRGTPMP